MQKIMVLLGSTRPGRQGIKIHEWFKQFIAEQPQKDVVYDFVDLADYNLPLLDESKPAMFGQYDHEHTKKWSEKVGQYDGFVFITPEYNHSFPAVLKNAIDYLYAEWNHKPVAFISYGYHLGVRAVEGLRLAVINLEMAPLNAHVEIDLTNTIDKNGEFTPSDTNIKQAEKLVTDMGWWSKVLTQARIDK